MSSNGMKMIIAIVRDADNDTILQALLDADYRVTKIASSGGFLRRGNTTLMIGVDEEQVEAVIQIIRDRCAPTIDLAVKHATVFVLDVNRFEQI